eukprot:CAMPEP_0178996340 /NCGR_PEP_ID=MMETSP0795-20121207/8318_1 /TAXON_ID=88552 /ORGANISM="Amoebophrya sp., Strain Ameob2" /LENGTH=516 /DNA_ID=CAMNT_0020688727 /DNA_START=52 /DNA_END=1602 /DNA_ORIENTATION=-
MIGVNPRDGPPEAPPKREVDGKGGMDEKRMQKLLALQKREQMKDVLIQRFKERANQHAASEKEKKQNEEIVASEVESFLNSASITENNLKKLDKKIRSKTSGGGGGGSAVGQQDQYSALSASKLAPSGLSGQETKESSLVADWRVLDEYALFQEDRSQIENRVKKYQSGQKVRSALNKQVVELKTSKQNERDDDRRWYARALADVEKYEKEEADKANEMKRQAMLEKHMRDDQLEGEHKARMEQKRIDALQNKLTSQRIQNEIANEDAKANRLRQSQRDHMAKVQAENEIDQKNRHAEKLRILEQDRLTMKQYNERMEEQERQRQAEKDARVARNDAAMARMATTVTAVQDAARAREEALTEEQNRLANENSLKRETDKANYLKKLRVETKDYHLRQMREKKGVKDEERAEARRQLEQCFADDKAHNDKEAEKRRNLRKRELANQEELNRMMREKGDRLREVEMSATEKKMNRELLKQVNKQLKDAGHSPRSVRSPVKKEVDPEVAIRFGLPLPEN